MYLLFVILIVIASILMIGIVLIQESKGGGLASNFSSSNQIMGVRKTTDFIEKANLQGDIKLGRTNKPYDLYKVNTQAGPCYLTKQYIEWLFLDTFMNNRDLNKKLPSRLIIRP